jgi:RNA polymerase sigma-70 factor (ECF subfamily)
VSEPQGAEFVELAARVAAAGPGTDGEAEERLCGALGRPIRLYGLRHLGRADLADDLVQDVLLLTLERLRAGTVRDPANLVSFVLGTCRRLIADGRKGERRRRGLETRFLPRGEPTAEPSAYVDRARLDHCLGALAERERVVVTLTFVAESDPGEIARALRLEPGHVRVVRHRALARLRDCMDGADGAAA